MNNHLASAQTQIPSASILAGSQTGDNTNSRFGIFPSLHIVWILSSRSVRSTDRHAHLLSSATAGPTNPQDAIILDLQRIFSLYWPAGHCRLRVKVNIKLQNRTPEPKFKGIPGPSFTLSIYPSVCICVCVCASVHLSSHPFIPSIKFPFSIAELSWDGQAEVQRREYDSLARLLLLELLPPQLS